MRAHLASCSLLLFAAACNKSTGDPPAPSVKPAGSPAAVPAPAPAPAPAAKPAATADSFDAHMKAGEKAENAKKWAEATAEFSAAVAARPDDAKALTEATWCADHSDDLSEAQSWGVAAVKAARKTSDPNLQAMALYDLGISWKTLDPHAARSLFEASMALRPNTTVERAAGALNARVKGTPDGDKLLAELGVHPSNVDTSTPPANEADIELIGALTDDSTSWSNGAMTIDLECYAGHSGDTCKEAGKPDGEGFYAGGDAGDDLTQLLFAKGVKNTMNDGSHLFVHVECHEDQRGIASDSCTVTRVTK